MAKTSLIQTIATLWPYMRKYRVRLFLGLSCTIVANLIKMALPQVLKQAIDYLDTGQITGWVRAAGVGFWGLDSTQVGSSEQGDWLFYFALVFVSVSLSAGIFLFLTRWWTVTTSRLVEFDLRNALFEQFTRLSQAYYSRSRIGDLMSRATNDMDAVRQIVGPALMYGVNAIVALSVASVFMFMISPTLTMFALIPFPVLAFAVNKVGGLIHGRFLTIQQKLGDLSSKIQENLTGIRVVKAYAQEESEIEDFRRMNDTFLEANKSLISLEAFFWPMMMTTAGFGVLIVVWYGGHLVIDGTITMGQFVQFNAYLMMLVWPAIAIGWVVNLFQRGSAALGRMREVLDEEPGVADTSALDGLEVSAGAVEFRNLSFEYPENEQGPVLNDVSIVVEAGTTLGIVGPTGSGKSTLVSLVSRVMNPPRGTVFIDGNDILDIPLRNLRTVLSIVPQESFLFSDTVAENVKFGRADADQKDVDRVTRIAQLYDEVESFPQGWQTMVGERGITLSGGQKQRAAIARALLLEPRILILDDALSAVDTNTEANILGGLRQEMESVTTLMISHRLSAVQHAEQIVYIADGKIVEQGNHDELMALGGKYCDLYQRQLLEAELEAA